MKCSSCGSEVKQGAKFCRECGTEIVEKTEVIELNTCSECGSLLEENALFCNNCGHRVSGENSETANKCPNCNGPLKDGALFCGECGRAVTEGNSKSNVRKKKKDKGLVFLIGLLVVVLIASASVIGYIYLRDNYINIETPNIEMPVDDNKQKGLDIEENDDVAPKKADTTDDLEEAEYIDDNFNIENEVLRIRGLYNTTQADLSSLTVDSSKNGKVKYYDSDSNLVRMDIAANPTTSYTKYYYFENGKLYFAFIFDGAKENRLYFKDNVLLRWIDESGKIHDRERSNGTFSEWEENVINDLNN